MFRLHARPFDPAALRQSALDSGAGGFGSFEGWVRSHHLGREVSRLEYEAHAKLAEREGRAVVDEALEKFDILHAAAAHRTGEVPIGGIAVMVVVSAVHRDPAFAACRYIIDEIKARVPIWKKEYFTDGTSSWARCDACAGGRHA